MNSGKIVERRDQVRTTFFSLFSFIAATFFVRWSSVNGPFFNDLLMPTLQCPCYPNQKRETRNEKRSSFLTLPTNDPLIRPLVIARLESARRLAPWRHRMASTGRLAFAAAMRM